MSSPAEDLAACVGFQWDEGNAQKNRVRHQVAAPECEEVFGNTPLVAAPDTAHSGDEVRYYVLGQTNGGRRLFVVCTVRARLIRVISARDMSRASGGCIAKRNPTPKTERRTRKPVPVFATEDAEREFWAKADSADYIDWARAEQTRLPALKPSTVTISLRLPEGMLDELKTMANARDVPYQSLLKIFLAERIRDERARRRRVG